ncbi:MAG: hypothetical protein V4651_13870 [Bacteroidota bacterium]
MSIDKNNYESYLMDYLDGKLDANEVSEVLLFLEQNPNIKVEFDGVAEINISGLAEIPVSFEYLKQKEFEQVKHEYEPLLIAAIEEELTTEELVRLEKGIRLYPELIKEQLLFTQTVLQPDYTITYPHKQSLKKGSIWMVHRNTMMRVAAILLMALSAGWYFVGNQMSFNTPVQHMVSLPSEVQPQHVNPVQASVSQDGQPATSPNDVKQLSDKKPITTSQRTKVAMNHTKIALIPEKESRDVISSGSKVENELNRVSTWLSYVQPQVPNKSKKEDNFTDLKTLAGVGINRGAQQLEEKTLSVLEAVNKVAGVSMEKDESSGKIKRVEIAGLGFEWSQSR